MDSISPQWCACANRTGRRLQLHRVDGRGELFYSRLRVFSRDIDGAHGSPVSPTLEPREKPQATAAKNPAHVAGRCRRPDRSSGNTAQH